MASLLETSSRRTGSVASPAVWAVLDRLGSVVAQIGETDSSAAVRPAGVDRSARFSQVAQYGDYGTQRFGSSGWTGAAGFTGQPGSPAGVNLFFARGYEPATGSWLSADPYRPGVADPASLNRYAYVSGNPATLVDLLGFRPVDPFDGYGTNTPSLQRSMGAATARLLGQARAWQAAGSPAIHTPAAASKPTQRHEYWWDNWSADMWQNIGAAVAGVATAVVVTAAVAGLVACTAATFGGCGVAAAIIGGAVAGAAGGAAGAAVTYGLS
ncbi:MAG TPA: RHS repeat-associated core domain-containing protein, partial [Microbacteriaceae bacterium]|nr:RHS repeat-associated core domain-containing protein [Microbacteriaceae bacterium]